MGTTQHPHWRVDQSETATPHYLLRLFVAGAGQHSRNAVSSVTALCEAYLQGRYVLEVIDIFQQPELTIVDNILATPTLIRLPPPLRRVVIGDFSDHEQVLQHLEIVESGGQRYV